MLGGHPAAPWAVVLVSASLVAACGAEPSVSTPSTATPGASQTISPPRPSAPQTESAVPSSTPEPDDRGTAPARLRIPSIDIDSRIEPVGTTDRVLDIPAQPWVVGWWEDGVGPGSGRGTTVLVAHLDSRTYGRGPFTRAQGLREGASAGLVDAEGLVHEYVVTAVDTYLKKALPYDDLFAQRGPERVVLVTCGGEYRRDSGGWDSNVVVTLEPAAL